METAEPLNSYTMLETMNIADILERVAVRLKTLGSRLSTIESPSLEVLEHLPRETRFFEPGSAPFGPPKPVSVGLDLEEARDECAYCAARLDEIRQKWYAVDTQGNDESEGPEK